MFQYIETFSRFTLNRTIGRKFLLSHREYAEFFSLSTQIWLDGKFPTNASYAAPVNGWGVVESLPVGIRIFLNLIGSDRASSKT